MNANLITYIGTKTVKAIPMDAAQAKEAGANVPEKYFDPNLSEYAPHAEGYLVQYADGYLSWSPKAVFDEAYRVAETYLQRMKIELDDLVERISKATKALYSYSMSCDREILQNQINQMHGYAEVLYKRIIKAQYKR